MPLSCFPPALFVLVFALSPFRLALFRLFQSAPCLFSLFAFSRAPPFPRRPVRPSLFVNRAPASFLLSLLQGFPFSFYIPLICSVLACSSLQILFFSRIIYTAHPSLLFTPTPFPLLRSKPFARFLLSACTLFALFLRPVLFAPFAMPGLVFPTENAARAFSRFLRKTKEGAWPSLFTVPYCFSCPPQSTAAGIFPRWRCALPKSY